MKKRPLSFYTRLKMRHRFTQGEFLDHKKFIEFLDKHDIKINEGMLESFEREGWLQPVFRLVLTEELQKSALILGIDGFKVLFKDGLMEFPKKGDYEPWNNFKRDYKKGERHDRKLVYYHPFQIMQVLNIFELKEYSLLCYDSDKAEDIKRKISAISRREKLSRQLFENKAKELTNLIGFLMLLEEPYRYHVFGSLTGSLFSHRAKYFDSWDAWVTERFSAKKFIQQHGLSVQEVEKTYEEIVVNAHSMDPLKQWYDLTRIMKFSTIKKLKGKPLTAQLYYGMSRMVALLYYDLTKKSLKEPDTLFDGRDGEWKKRIYSDPFDYATNKTQRGIIRYFVRDPTTRIFFLVEGDTEEKVIEKIFERFQVSMIDDGINVVNCRGIGNMDEQKLDAIIKTANKDDVSMYILADNEGKSVRKVEKIETHIRTGFCYRIWNKSFEEDNFGKRKVIDLINGYLEKYDEHLTDREIALQQKNGMVLVKSIEEAYRQKYHKTIYRVIRKSKPDFSLELMAPRLKKISPEKRVGKQSEIEKVVDEVFKMIPNWG